jgi:hypothetical protein
MRKPGIGLYPVFGFFIQGMRRGMSMIEVTDVVMDKLCLLCYNCPANQRNRGAHDTVDGVGVGPQLEPDSWTCPAGEPYLCIGDKGCVYEDEVNAVLKAAQDLMDKLEDLGV